MLWLALLSQAAAQDWSTRADCTVDQAVVDPAVLPAGALETFTAEAADIPNSTGRFWRVTSPDGAVSHLWGTLHSTDPLILDLPDMVEHTIERARVVAPEVNFIHPSRASVTKSLEYPGWMRPTGTFYRFSPENTGISAPVIEKIRARTQALGWRSNAPDYLTLAGLISLLLTDPCDDFASAVLPIQDDRIQMLGMIHGAEVLGLEDPDDFITYLNDGKNRATALSILQVYANYLGPQAGARATSFALYRAGQIGVMMRSEAAFMAGKLGADAEKHLARTDAYLVHLRNEKFLARALPDLQQGGVFMAIGAFHLPGENGMIAMMRNAGFTVTRVPTPQEAPTP